jgi:hypothetical protein
MKAAHNATMAARSDTTAAHSDTTVARSDMMAARNDMMAARNDTTAVHSDTTAARKRGRMEADGRDSQGGPRTTSESLRGACHACEPRYNAWRTADVLPLRVWLQL